MYNDNLEWILESLNDSNTYDLSWMRLNDEKVFGNILWEGVKNANRFYIRDGKISLVWYDRKGLQALWDIN